MGDPFVVENEILDLLFYRLLGVLQQPIIISGWNSHITHEIFETLSICYLGSV